MAKGDGDDAEGGQRFSDPRSRARDWITLWQSELSALATDREVQEAWQRGVSLWANAADALIRVMPDLAREPARQSGAAASPGTAPARPHADDGGARTIERLESRIAELERRLAEVERRS